MDLFMIIFIVHICCIIPGHKALYNPTKIPGNPYLWGCKWGAGSPERVNVENPRYYNNNKHLTSPNKRYGWNQTVLHGNIPNTTMSVVWPRAEKETARTRSKLVKQLEDWDMVYSLVLLAWSFWGLDPIPHVQMIITLQDCHARAWDAVGAYVEDHLKIFSSKTLDAEGTLMPASRSWLREMSQEVGLRNQPLQSNVHPKILMVVLYKFLLMD